MKTALIYQPCGLGDILFLQKVAHRFANQGYEVYWPVVHELAWLDDYIPEINFVSWDDTDKLLTHKDPLPEHVQFPYKERYDPYGETEFTKDFIFFQGFINKRPVMAAKYDSIRLDYLDWRDFIQWDRNREKECQLYYDVLGLQEDSEYVIVNNRYATRPYPMYNDKVPTIHDKHVVNLNPIEGYSMFDWLKVIRNSKEIYSIETAWNYFFESPKLFHYMHTKKLELWHRSGNWSEVAYLFNLPWKYN